MMDVIIEKSTIDTLLCGKKAFLNVARTLFEMQRVLRPDGVIIIISYAKPEQRLRHLKRLCLSFDIKVEELNYWQNEQGEYLTHYAYILRKASPKEIRPKLAWRRTKRQIAKEEAEQEGSCAVDSCESFTFEDDEQSDPETDEDFDQANEPKKIETA